MADSLEKIASLVQPSSLEILTALDVVPVATVSSEAVIVPSPPLVDMKTAVVTD